MAMARSATTAAWASRLTPRLSSKVAEDAAMCACSPLRRGP